MNSNSFRVLTSHNQDNINNKKEPPPPVMFTSKVPVDKLSVIEESTDLFLFKSSSHQTKKLIDIAKIQSFNSAHGFIKLTEKEDKDYLAYHRNLFEKNIPFIFSTPPPPHNLISTKGLPPPANVSK